MDVHVQCGAERPWVRMGGKMDASGAQTVAASGLSASTAWRTSRRTTRQRSACGTSSTWPCRCVCPPHPGVQPPRTGSFSHKSQRMKIGVPPKCFFCVFSFSIFEVSQGPTAAACPQPRWTQVAGGLWIVVWVRPTPRLYRRRAGWRFGAIEASKPRIFEVLPPSQGAVAPEDLSDFCLGICQGS